MKFSKYIILSAMVAAMTVIAPACSSKDEKGGGGGSQEDGKVAVGITTTIFTKATVKNTFTDGDKMNIWPKSYNHIGATNLVNGCVATFQGGSWKLNPEVRIADGEHAFIYAVSPYDASYTDPAKIPVDLSKQIDLLYSGTAVPVSFTTNVAKLQMKHALAQAVFNIATQGYSGEGLLQSISINGEKVYTKGTLDVSTGKITGTGTTQVTVSTSKKATNKGWTSDLPSMWIIPFNTAGATATLTAVIDGKSYVVDFPKVEMKLGYQYTFRLTLTQLGLEFIPSLTEERSLNDSTDSMQVPEGYGMLTFGVTAGNWALPYLTGEGVFGTAAWNGGTETYGVGKSITIPAGVTSVQLESWNSTGFELETLEGLTTIDVSQYVEQ